MKGAPPLFENALKQTELLLRNRNIEDLTLPLKPDLIDTLDITNNQLRTFPNIHFSRLKTLLLACNEITDLKIDAPQLESLSLAYNPISDFSQLLFLKSLNKLQYLCVLGTPLSKVPDYRSLILQIQPNIRYIDFQHVSQKERPTHVSKRVN